MKFFADFSALSVSHALPFLGLPSTLLKPKICKANKKNDPSVVCRFRSRCVRGVASRPGPPSLV